MVTGQVGQAGAWEASIQLDVSATASSTLLSQVWGLRVVLGEEDREMERVPLEGREESQLE